ncbi:peptidylprolyl isomerase [Porphyromonas endodontalis]|uniref:peptidylprolyl isomerase n=1 Tax=Porphyromonas endodontalis TaxID=28124 RepID=UPI00361A3B5B
MKRLNSLRPWILAIGLSCVSMYTLLAQQVIDEVVWMVGDEAILRSDVEYQKLRLLSQGVRLDANSECALPEQLAVQMLFLNQAKIDSITVDDAMINRYVEANIQGMIAEVGSKEKLEEYFNKSLTQIREDQRRQAKSGEIVRAMQQKLVSNISVSPSEIRAYFASIPTDSLPYIPTRLEVQKIVRKPIVKLSEIDRIKQKLREYSEEVNSGKTSFSTLARLYSEDTRTALNGGEYGFVAKTSLESEFARILFDMPNNKRVSPIIQSEEGYHIVQIIEKRGDLINFRHILLRPKVADEALETEVTKLDSIAGRITSGALSFEAAVAQYSQDEETSNSEGLLVNTNYQSTYAGSSFFPLEELPQDISREVANLKVGELSRAFVMINEKGNREVLIVKLRNKHDAHRATLTEDYQTIKEMALQQKRNQELDDWVRTQQLKTFIEVAEGYRNCDFKYPGWIHDNK